MNITNKKRVVLRFFTMVTVFFMITLTTGCIRVEYTGTPLSPLGEDAKVAVYYSMDKLPAAVDKLQKAGSLTASGSTASTTVNDMRNKIIECARAHGANIVLFTSVEYIPDGGARADQIQNISAPGWDRVDNTATNVKQEWSAFLYSGEQEPEIPIYTVKMKADLYLAPAELIKRREVKQTRTPSFPLPESKNTSVKVNVL